MIDQFASDYSIFVLVANLEILVEAHDLTL